MQRHAAPCSAVRCHAASRSAMQCCAVPCSVTQRHAVPGEQAQAAHLGALREAELVHMHVPPKRYQADVHVVWEGADCLRTVCVGGGGRMRRNEADCLQEEGRNVGRVRRNRAEYSQAQGQGEAERGVAGHGSGLIPGKGKNRGKSHVVRAGVCRAARTRGR
eukprot:133901-Chlamydomonas_euryale.AAC.6